MKRTCIRHTAFRGFASPVELMPHTLLLCPRW